jgi:hypothetical protein
MQYCLYCLDHDSTMDLFIYGTLGAGLQPTRYRSTIQFYLEYNSILSLNQYRDHDAM